MAIISMPDDELFCPSRVTPLYQGANVVNRSPINGAVDVVDLIGDGWFWILDFGARSTDGERDRQRGFFNRFRGGTDLLRCWPFMRPVPRGTLRGSPTLGATVAAGEMTIVVVGSSGATLESGDFLGVTFPDTTTQLVEVHSASGTGTITVVLNAPLRQGANAGSAVVWNKPTADFWIPSPPSIPHGPGVSGGFTVELEEWIE